MPHLFGHFDHDLEFIEFRPLADFIAHDRAGKTALRAQGELSQRKMLRRVPYSQEQVICAFQ